MRDTTGKKRGLAVAVMAAAGAVVAAIVAPSWGADKRLTGPVEAEVVRVVDGDTLVVRAMIWPEHWVETSVRLVGLDTPELHGRCAEEKDAATRAKALTESWVAAQPDPGRVRLYDVQLDKYGGRVLGTIEKGDGLTLAATLIKAGLARPYDGGKRGGWCG